jgi:RNA polymerase sigma-70 factor (ECF subfamily)
VAATTARAQKTRLRALRGGGASQESSVSDEQLIEAIRRGDQHVAAELYDRLIHVVDRTLYKVFGRREPDHDDLVQTVFEQIVSTLSRRTFAGACNLQTWASSIAGHVGVNALRARRRERKWLDRGADVVNELERRTSIENGERPFEARSRLDQVRRHLVSMKPEQAETVFLHDGLGHDLAEIAIMMGASLAATQSRLVRGRRELFRRLDRDDAQPAGALGAGCPTAKQGADR